MGIKSTYDIDRETAITVIHSKLHNCTNEELASILLEFKESYFRNYIVHDQLPDTLDKYDKVIRTVGEFD